VKQVVPLTEETERIQTALMSLVDRSKASYKVGSKTALWDSIRDASEFLESPTEGDVIYVLTDAQDNASKIRVGDVEKILVSRGIRMFSFRIEEPDAGFTADEYVKVQDFNELVKVTGGTEVAISQSKVEIKSPFLDKSGKPTRLASLLAVQYQLLPARYELMIETNAATQQSTGWKLEVTGLREQDLLVVYPQRLASCHELTQARMQGPNKH